MNQVRFSTAYYDDKKLNYETKMVWIPINSQLREEKVYSVKLTDLGLEDLLYQFSGLTEQDRRIFRNEFIVNRPYEFPDYVHLQITFEFDLTLYKIDRDVYSVLDWFGDVGGLYEGLYRLFNFIVALFYYRALEHYLIENLFLK